MAGGGLLLAILPPPSQAKRDPRAVRGNGPLATEPLPAHFPGYQGVRNPCHWQLQMVGALSRRRDKVIDLIAH